MEKYSAEQIQKKYDALSLNVRGVFEGAETAEALQQIGKEHGLMLDQLGDLADETGLVILGLTHPKDYINNLSVRLSIEKEEAKNIAEKINQKVFQKIREELKKIHGIEENMETTPPPKMPEVAKLPVVKPEINKETRPTAIQPAMPNYLPAITKKPEIAATPQPSTPPPLPTPEATTPAPAVKPAPSPVSPFEQKLKENEIIRSPIKPAAAILPVQPATETMPRYTGKDPYREPTE